MDKNKPDVFERAWLFLAAATCENAGAAAVALKASDRKEGEPCYRRLSDPACGAEQMSKELKRR